MKSEGLHPAHLLSSYLDGELSRRKLREVERHLKACTACRQALEELRALVESAAGLREDSEAAGDLWPRVRARLRPRRHAWHPVPGLGWLSRVSWRPALAAVALALVAIAAGVFLLLRSGRPVEESPSARQPSSAPILEAHPFEASPEYYDTLAQLEQAARARLTHDPRVVAVLEENLQVLDTAIAQYSDALVEEPGDAQLAGRIEAARQRKLEVLREAVALAGEAGN